jgi:hypothetical protein
MLNNCLFPKAGLYNNDDDDDDGHDNEGDNMWMLPTPFT